MLSDDRPIFSQLLPDDQSTTQAQEESFIVLPAESGTILSEIEFQVGGDVDTLRGEAITPVHPGHPLDVDLVGLIEAEEDKDIVYGGIGDLRVRLDGLLVLTWNTRTVFTSGRKFRVLSFQIGIQPGSRKAIITNVKLKVDFISPGPDEQGQYTIRNIVHRQPVTRDVVVNVDKSREVKGSFGVDDPTTHLKALLEMTKGDEQNYQYTDEKGMSTLTTSTRQSFRTIMSSSRLDRSGLGGSYEISMILTEGAEGGNIKLKVKLEASGEGFIDKIMKYIWGNLEKTVEVFYGEGHSNGSSSGGSGSAQTA